MEKIKIFFKPEFNSNLILEDEIFQDKTTKELDKSVTLTLYGKCNFESSFVIITFNHDKDINTPQRRVAFPAEFINRIDIQPCTKYK